jgi:hypothetical protein
MRRSMLLVGFEPKTFETSNYHQINCVIQPSPNLASKKVRFDYNVDSSECSLCIRVLIVHVHGNAITKYVDMATFWD